MGTVEVSAAISKGNVIFHGQLMTIQQIYIFSNPSKAYLLNWNRESIGLVQWRHPLPFPPTTESIYKTKKSLMHYQNAFINPWKIICTLGGTSLFF